MLAGKKTDGLAVSLATDGHSNHDAEPWDRSRCEETSLNSCALATRVGSIDRFGANGSVPRQRKCGLPRHQALIH